MLSHNVQILCSSKIIANIQIKDQILLMGKQLQSDPLMIFLFEDDRV